MAYETLRLQNLSNDELRVTRRALELSLHQRDLWDNSEDRITLRQLFERATAETKHRQERALTTYRKRAMSVANYLGAHNFPTFATSLATNPENIGLILSDFDNPPNERVKDRPYYNDARQELMNLVHLYKDLGLLHQV